MQMHPGAGFRRTLFVCKSEAEQGAFKSGFKFLRRTLELKIYILKSDGNHAKRSGYAVIRWSF
jgi:hypothetical protein